MDIDCSQRLECTQELYNTQTEKTDPEQIGFVGICGTKYPVKRGPNKIGRDPRTCRIVLDLNSISRQHAVINVLNLNEIMLMDLDSSNKTKVQGKTLPPYIPHPLQNGDMVQFGDVFGVFRLLEDENDLPMTQALDIPCTPVPVSKQMSRSGAPPVLVPESPEVSDKDDSFIMPSQPKRSSDFKCPMNKYLKTSNKTIAIQPIGSKKIDNAYWQSGKKSASFNFQLDDSGSSLNDSVTSNQSNKVIDESIDNIHEAETQQPEKCNENTDSIYTANTQLPTSSSIHTMDTQQPVPDIYNLNTQPPVDIHALNTQEPENIHNCNTQAPTNEHLPEVRKINEQEHVQLDLFTDNKENDDSIFNAETQQFPSEKEAVLVEPKQSVQQVKNDFDEEILFDEISTQSFHEEIPEVSKTNKREHVRLDLFTDNKENDDGIFNAETQQFPSKKEAFLVEPKQPEQQVKNDSDEEILFDEISTQSFHEEIPEVSKTNKQEHVKLDLFTDNKENDNSRFNADTQEFQSEKESVSVEPKQPEKQEKNDSDEEILFDEISTQSFHEEMESQPLLPAEVSPQIDRVENIEVSAKTIRVQSDSSIDCEDFDILPTQKITTDIDLLPPQKITNDIDILPTQKITNDDEDLTDCEDDFVNTEIKEPKGSPEMDFEDMATQVIGDEEIETELNKNKDQTDGPAKGTTFEEMPTQIITDSCKTDNLEDMPTQLITVNDPNESVNEPDPEIYSEEMISPFKVPFPTPLKSKKTSKLVPAKVATPRPVDPRNDDNDDPNYYAATQDIMDDLCSQKEPYPQADKQGSKSKEQLDNDELVPCSVEEYEMGDRFRHIENELSPVKKLTTTDKKQVSKSKLSSTTDIEVKLKTPKTIKIINAELPDSQEIKTSVTLNHKSITESSSESEVEEVSDQDSGITFGRKNRSKRNAKVDLSKRFEESLPTRIITRVRKPTYKLQTSDEATKKQCKSILTNPLLVDSEDSLDTEIINENISRFKSKADRKKKKGDNNSKHQSVDTDKRPESRNENKNADKSSDKSDSRSRSSRSKSKKSKEVKLENDSKEEESVRSTRSTRNKRENNVKDEKSKSDRNNGRKSKETDRSNSESRSRTRSDSRQAKTKRDNSKSKKENKTLDKTESSPEIEIRRSKRQRTKDSKEGAKHEMSTVYLSSESNSESPRPLKRPASNELEVPSPKRTRSLPNSKSSVSAATSDASVCSTPARAAVHHVLFTAFSNDNVRSKLETLGAVLVTDVMECTVLVTMQIKRTFKLLCAVGLGRPIVGPDWVQACADTNTIVDPWLYIIKDAQAERRFRFNLEKTLRGKRNFLKGYNVSSTTNVLPNAQEMKLIVECSGGTWKAEGPRWVCVSSSADRAQWAGLKRRGAVVVSTEFILGGVLRQRADADAAALGVAKKKGEAVGEFVCAQCGRRCLSRIGLASHVKAHTRS